MINRKMFFGKIYVLIWNNKKKYFEKWRVKYILDFLRLFLSFELKIYYDSC